MKKAIVEKANEGKSVAKEPKRVCFQLSREGLQCFMSKKRLRNEKSQLGTQFKKQIKDQPVEASTLNLKDTKHTNHRRRVSSYISNDYQTFHNKLLLMQYDDHDLYVDSIKHSGRDKSKTPSPKHQTQQPNQYDFETPCVRVITQETTHSSNTKSNNYGSRTTTTPEGSCIYDYAYSSQFYFPQSYSNRNRRAVSTQQSNAFQIDIDNIQNDGRSTIMVRNIPNKYTQQMLLELFSFNNKKKFDFFYLPIDYKNNCNVGYAFLNFVHAKFIRDFYLQFHNKKWNKFNSEKICCVCYARIQGTAQLENHFQNSKVIHQKDKRMRPLGINDTIYSNIQSLVQKQQQKIDQDFS